MTRNATTFVALIVFTALYVVAGKLGLSMAFLNASASPIWPPTGLALAAMLLFGYRLWPAVLVGAFVVNLTTAGTISTSAVIAAGNTLEAVVGAMLVRRFASGTAAFELVPNIFRFTVFAAIPSTMISAYSGSHVPSHSPLRTVGFVWTGMDDVVDWRFRRRSASRTAFDHLGHRVPARPEAPTHVGGAGPGGRSNRVG